DLGERRRLHLGECVAREERFVTSLASPRLAPCTGWCRRVRRGRRGCGRVPARGTREPVAAAADAECECRDDHCLCESAALHCLAPFGWVDTRSSRRLSPGWERAESYVRVRRSASRQPERSIVAR